MTSRGCPRPPIADAAAATCASDAAATGAASAGVVSAGVEDKRDCARLKAEREATGARCSEAAAASREPSVESRPEAAAAAAAAATGETKEPNEYELTGWLNTSDEHSFNALHDHGSAAWSWVYFVADGGGGAAEDGAANSVGEARDRRAADDETPAAAVASSASDRARAAPPPDTDAPAGKDGSGGDVEEDAADVVAAAAPSSAAAPPPPLPPMALRDGGSLLLRTQSVPFTHECVSARAHARVVARDVVLRRSSSSPAAGAWPRAPHRRAYVA